MWRVSIEPSMMKEERTGTFKCRSNVDLFPLSPSKTHSLACSLHLGILTEPLFLLHFTFETAITPPAPVAPSTDAQGRMLAEAVFSLPPCLPRSAFRRPTSFMQSPALQEQPTSPYANMIVPKFDFAEMEEASLVAKREFATLSEGFAPSLLVAMRERDKMLQSSKMVSQEFKFVVLRRFFLFLVERSLTFPPLRRT
jgi:hypothetical protein